MIGSMENKVTVPRIIEAKSNREKIVAITAYDWAMARLVDAAGVDIVLVGDSVATTSLGYETTLPVTMDAMIHHAGAVSRGVGRALVVADMPFMSYHLDDREGVLNAGRFLKEAGCQAVKLEGGSARAALVEEMISLGIPVMGHLGMTPQSVHVFGGHRQQAREEQAADRLMEDAVALQKAGAFALVLELIPHSLAAEVTRTLHIPTIGIGAGPDCDGQIQVLHDLIGLIPEQQFRHARRYLNGGELIQQAVSQYAEEVRQNRFMRKAAGS